MYCCAVSTCLFLSRTEKAKSPPNGAYEETEGKAGDSLRCIGATHAHDTDQAQPAVSTNDRYLAAQPKGDKRLWETAALSHLRDGFRSGDLWLPRPRRHGDPTQAPVPLSVTTSEAALAVPLNAGEWLTDRQAWMALESGTKLGHIRERGGNSVPKMGHIRRLPTDGFRRLVSLTPNELSTVVVRTLPACGRGQGRLQRVRPVNYVSPGLDSLNGRRFACPALRLRPLPAALAFGAQIGVVCGRDNILPKR